MRAFDRRSLFCYNVAIAAWKYDFTVKSAHGAPMG